MDDLLAQILVYHLKLRDQIREELRKQQHEQDLEAIMANELKNAFDSMRKAKEKAIKNVTKEALAVASEFMEMQADAITALALPRAEIAKHRADIDEMRAEFATLTNAPPSGPLDDSLTSGDPLPVAVSNSSPIVVNSPSLSQPIPLPPEAPPVVIPPLSPIVTNGGATTTVQSGIQVTTMPTDVGSLSIEELKSTLNKIEIMHQNSLDKQNDPKFREKFKNQPPPEINPAFLELKTKIQNELDARQTSIKNNK